MTTFRHGRYADAVVFLQLTDPLTLDPVTGKTPEVQIRRHRDSQTGGALDGWYWNGATFISTPTWLPMAEFDATNSPGLYTYLFLQSLVQANMACWSYFRHTAAPEGFDIEQHIFTDEVTIWTGTPVVPVVPGDTVMGRLAAMELPSGAVAQANADANWDEPLAGHTTPGTAGYALAQCTAGLTGAHQIDVTIEDTNSNKIQGAQVDVYDAGNTQFLARFHTDINGLTALALDAGTYNLRIWATGYSFTVPEVLVVTGNASVTYQGTSGIVITPPSAPDLCVIYGYVNDGAGQPIGGACVSAIPTLPQELGNAQAGDRAIHTTTREDGYFELELVRTSEVRFTIENTEYDEIKTVPDAASQLFTTWP
jgi:hypothetical protein